ncbi:hypothetical protein AN958_01977 [Leucoagaricus sp. SymC.cos]|nr:hypothetical protein AN958_01977 [Leucoagaricus sp. SymC.cos]
MATVFQRLMPALDDSQAPQIIHQRRRRDSVEVIDVDELDDDIYQTHRAPEPDPSRSAQRRRLNMPSEIISLLDSDDDDIVISETRIRPASRTRLQSPPPRNQSWGPVPPVPQVPQRFAGQTSFPMRHQGPPGSSPPAVRPNDQPFPFEANMRQQQPHRQLAPIPGVGPPTRQHHIHVPRLNDPEVLPRRPLQAAPPSHHVPSMGLGGALIAQNRPRNHDRHQHRPYLPFEAGHPFNGRVGSGPRRIFGAEMLRRRNSNNAREESPYRKEYTHPRPPEPGFTFDFAPNPLILGNNLTYEEQKDRRVWGLRCGHLIDGKCLKEIGQPRYTEQATDPVSTTAFNATVVDRKGKGKAKAVDEDKTEFQDMQGSYDVHHRNPGQSQDHEPETNSIRSRLRPRHPAASASSSSSSSSTPAQTTVKRNSRTKALAQPQLPPPEYIWHCPVTGCGRVHISIKINGEWVPERDNSIHADSSAPSGSGSGSGGRGRGGRGGARGARSRAPLFGDILNGSGSRLVNGGEGARGAIPVFL